MKYQCIVCARTWGYWEEGEDQSTYSHGLCRLCVIEKLLPKIRVNQLKEGFSDCFGRCQGYCHRDECKYKNVCENLYTKVEYDLEHSA